MSFTRRQCLAWAASPLLAAPRDSAFERMIAEASPENRRNTEADIAVLPHGKLLVAWSDFYGGARDESAGRISAATSTDGGKTWSKRYTLQENTGKQNVMSVSFLRSRSGDLLFFYLVKNSSTDLYVEMRRSRDHARTWSAPVRLMTDPGYFVVNNARFIQLRTGRILCPAAVCVDVVKREMPFRTVMYFSDDDGRTWKRGKQILDCPKRGAMEPGLVELKDGRVLQIIRTQTGRIWHSYSSDGGDTWTTPEPWTVATPEAPATLVRLPRSRNLLLVYNPGTKRTPLLAAVSRDEGKSWSTPKTLEDKADETYAYTSITPYRGRVLLTYYVARAGTLSLKFKSIPQTWFEG